MNSEKLESNKSLAKAFFIELVNERKYDRIAEIFSDDVEISPIGLKGHAGVDKWLRFFHTTFPDCFDVITGQWAEGDQVVTRIRFEGTHEAEWMGFAPTGKHVSWEGIAIHTIHDGKISRMEAVIDQAETFRQLGWLKP